MTGLFLFLAFNTLAGNIDVQPGKKNAFEIKESSWQLIRFTHSTAEIKTLSINAEGNAYTRLVMPGYSHTQLAGSPELPVRRELVEVPVGATVRVEIIHATWKDYNLGSTGYSSPVMPAQPPAVKSNDIVPFIIDQDAYRINSFYPKELVSFEILGMMRSYRVGRLDIQPVQYNPVTHTLRVYDEIEAVVRFDNADLESTRELKEKYENFYFRSAGEKLVNYQAQANRDTLTSYPVSYLIVSDPMFQSQLQPFIEWKTKQGFAVTVGYTNQPEVGTTAYAIKSYIQNKYNNPAPGQQPPSFVLFVGDIQQIPAWNGNAGSHVTDLYYCEYTGDLLPEIYYGRFSAQNTNQLQPQIDKTLQYEQYTIPDPSYLNEVVMVAGVDATHSHNWANGQINYGTINYFNEAHGIISHTYLYPESDNSSEEIIQDISDGVTYANYTAHCGSDGWSDPPFLTSDIPSLQNQDMYAVLVGNCCLSSKYDDSECFAEALLRAVSKGAVAYIGGSNSTYWDEDYYFSVGVGEITEIPPSYEEKSTLGMYDRAFHTHGEPWADWYATTDQHVYAGNMSVMTGAPGSAEYYWEIYCVMGDPSLMCYYSEPDPLAVDYQPLMPLGSTSFTINTEPYAYVGISVDGILKGAALADAMGVALVPLTPITVPGIADIVITKQNRQPYIGTVIVANPEGPYILLDSFQAVELSGYTNNKIEPGEVIGLTINLKNYGMSEGSDVVAHLSTSDEYVTITDDTEDCGPVPAQMVSTFENAFSLVVNDVIPDGHVVEFTVNIEDVSRETWVSDMTMTLSAPVFDLVGITVNDNAGGNGNGRLDAGETADIIAVFVNIGHSIARNTVASLCAHSAFVTILNPDYTIGNMGFFGNTTVTFQATVDNKAPNGILVDFVAGLGSGKLEMHKTWPLMIGVINEDFESGNFSAFNWNQGGNLPWTVSNVYPFEGVFSAKSGAITDNQTSELSLNYNVMQADSLTFYRKVSSEPGDKLRFIMDGTILGDWSGTNSGGWRRESYPVNPGNHIFKWTYSKNASGSAGSDAGWIDYIDFPPTLATTLYAGDDSEVCPNGTFQCAADATNFQTVSWTTSGTGQFSDQNSLDPVYSPGSSDYETGQVILTINIVDNQSDMYNDDLLLNFREMPGQTGMPSGPVEVLVDTSYIAEYSVSPLEEADSYTWAVNPPEAGFFTGFDETGVIVWNRDFAGTAAITVTPSSDCGNGTPSQGLVVTIKNSTVGIADPVRPAIGLAVYPNPATDRIHVILAGENLKNPVVRIVNMMGNELFMKNDIVAGEPVEIPVEQLQPGMYLVTFRSGDDFITRKIIIK